jgi:vacuolar-type H+-ATPase subunit I/STV1
MNRLTKSPALALTLAFLPSAMLLLSFCFAWLPSGVFAACGIISIVCCFIAARLLFRRGTGLAIFGGIVFILLNAFISLLFGCGAIGPNFH